MNDAASRHADDVADPLGDGPVDLPYEHERYFTAVETSPRVALADLSRSRVRPEGVRNALTYMREAYEGRREKRNPVSVRPRIDGGFDVVDGNSTVTVALRAGWPDIPCQVLTRHPEGERL